MAMRSGSFDVLKLDVGAFCRAGARLQGAWILAELPRLQACGQPEGAAHDFAPVPVSWAAAGEVRPARGGGEEMWLDLQAEACIALQCQRCLQPMQQALKVHRWIRFVRDEAEAERLDEELEDDVLALTSRLNLRDLVEDELILALPLVPRHDACPAPLATTVAQEAPVPPVNPFAALAKLREPDSD
jgi:uncharacterized protein